MKKEEEAILQYFSTIGQDFVEKLVPESVKGDVATIFNTRIQYLQSRLSLLEKLENENSSKTREGGEDTEVVETPAGEVDK